MPDMPPISGRTAVYGIFGDPVAHSLSPAMQNAAFAAAGIDAIYVPFHVRTEALGAAVAALRALNVAGVNVTIPHKERILEHLDEVDHRARSIGAVNTVVNRGGRLLGYNTDGVGLVRALQAEFGCSPRGSRILLLGAGGACRAAVVALAAAGAAWIGIANRRPARAEQLVADLRGICPGTSLAAFPLASEALAPVWSGVELLVNTSAVGLHGESFALPVAENLPLQARVYDMVYRRGETPLLDAAKARGLAFADGRGMLVGQGEEAFRLWTGEEPPSGVMRARVLTESSAI